MTAQIDPSVRSNSAPATRHGRIAVTVGCVALAACLLAGCTTYYSVKAPDGETEYLTTDLDRNRKSESISFTDAKTGAEVTLKESEVRTISKSEYHERLKGADGS